MLALEIDVSELEAPEPMRVILSTLTSLTRQQQLIVRHRQQPFPLYHKLRELGFDYQVRQHDEHYLITISHGD